MARPYRLQAEGYFYHVTSRGNRRQAIYWSDKGESVDPETTETVPGKPYGQELYTIPGTDLMDEDTKNHNQLELFKL